MSEIPSGEFMLFGVRVVVDSMRKSVSLNNLSQYHQLDNSSKDNLNKDNLVKEGYASADDAIVNSSGSRERKRGVAWSEEEHKLFLVGLEQVGKGDWRGISRNYVKTRTPTQVASHAQKYFLRRTNLNRRRRRSSLFDITTPNHPLVLETPMEQDKVQVDDKQSLSPPTASEPPRNAGTIVFTAPVENLAVDMAKPICQTPHLNLNLQSPAVDPLGLSLGLSLSSSQGLPRFDNRDSMISVA